MGKGCNALVKTVTFVTLFLIVFPAGAIPKPAVSPADCISLTEHYFHTGLVPELRFAESNTQNAVRELKQDVTFGYLVLFVKQALRMEVSEQWMKYHLQKNLAHIGFNGCDVARVSKEDDAFLIPWQGEKKPPRVLRFSLAEGNAAGRASETAFVFDGMDISISDVLVTEETGANGRVSGGVPKSFPAQFISPAGNFPVETEILTVDRKGIVMMPRESAEKHVLNTGVLAVDGLRCLFVRRVGRKLDGDLRRSVIGLFVHRINDGDTFTEDQTVEIDADMILPDGEDIVAVEDARVLERDGTIYVSMTAVRKDGSYYPAVTRHDTAGFLAKVSKKLAEIDQGIAKSDIKWEWTKLAKAVDCEGTEVKNFVMFPDPIDGYEYAVYRPVQFEKSTMRMAMRKVPDGQEKDAPFRDAWLFGMTHSPLTWGGASVQVSGLPEPRGGRDAVPFGIMTTHAARFREDGSKYYDLRMMIYNRENPMEYHITGPILVPEEGYELEGWVPGAIYSCGVILTGYDVEKGIYTVDIYYSGSDSAILMATVTMKIRVTKDGPGIKKWYELTAESVDELVVANSKFVGGWRSANNIAPVTELEQEYNDIRPLLKELAVSPWDFSKEEIAPLKEKIKKWKEAWHDEEYMLAEESREYSREIPREIDNIIDALEELAGTEPAQTLYHKFVDPVSRLRAGDMFVAFALAYTTEKTDTVLELSDLLKTTAFASKRNGRKIMLGLDLSWIPASRSEGHEEDLQLLLKEIRLVCEELGIVVVMEKGEDLVRTIRNRAEAQGINLTNIGIMGKADVLRASAFDEFRSTIETKKAKMIGIDTVNLTKFSDVMIVELVKLAVQVVRWPDDVRENTPGMEVIKSTEHPWEWVIVPAASKWNGKKLRKLYSAQRQALHAA